ncbi:hypothetical protein [Cellulophaga sp. Hel_I_12]|uniref:hypothetical protein n=1 Tax=Cellulophaga sp. Hel_I_12 TaxID=1249972 RepID=UPI0012E09205|nr:hypothetical protein [Cellulophaga sp. Hel_I_12]
MKPKFKSLLYLCSFAVCAIFYHQMEETPAHEEVATTKFAANEGLENKTSDVSPLEYKKNTYENLN